MPTRRLHCVEHARNEFLRYVVMEEVAHGIDEDHARLAPVQRLLQALGPHRQVKAVLKGMAMCAPETFGKSLCVAVVAAGTDLRAPRHRVPRRIGPLDCRSIGHALRLPRESYHVESRAWKRKLKRTAS